MKLPARLKTAYNNLTYQKKLLFPYLALVFVPLLIMFLYFYAHTARSMRQHADTLSMLHMNYTTTGISDTFSEMLALAKNISLSGTIRETLDNASASDRIVKHSADLDTMELSLKHIHYDSGIYSVRLFVDPSLPYAQRSIFTWSLDQLPVLFPGMEKQLRTNPTLLGPFPVEKPLGVTDTVFSVTLPLESYSDYNRLLAVICIDVTEEHILEIMKTADYSQNGAVYLTDASGNALTGYSFATQTALFGEELQTFAVSKEGSQYYLDGAQVTISPPVWNTYHLVAVSRTGLLARTSYLLPQLIALGTFLGFAIYGLASSSSRHNAGRIVELSKIAREIQKGNLNVRCTADSPDEVGELQISFNEMILRMQGMLDSQYRLGRHLKDQELKLLQAQIDPHFLYNTLDLIIWTAQSKSPDEVCDIVRSLSRYYRISLSNGQDVIPIEKELEHVMLYVALQNKRFQNKIRLVTHISDEVRHISVLKLLLQPLVENSIVHGFNGISEIITIDVSRVETDICITVSDNGIGMAPDKLARLRLFQELTASGSDQEHYGLSNIQDRLRSFYGPKAHMDFDSAMCKGTTVSLSFPASGS